MAKEGVLPALNDMFGPGGNRQLDEMKLADAYLVRVESLRDLIDVYDREVTMLERRIHQLLARDRGYQTIQALNGVGRTIAAIFVTEIGDITRFRSPQALCSWAGLTPRHRESDTKVTRGRITKQGSRLVRWAALEAIVRYHGGSVFHDQFHRIAERRGKNKARIAVARKLLTLVYYGLRDGEIRCLRATAAAA
jgi:transposase